MDSSYRARLRAGDAAAFGRLFDDHARAVHRHAYRSTGCWSTAEDVVSLTYLEAWRLRGKLRPDGESVLPWLLGIATNVLRNTNRAARRHRAALARVPRADTVPDFADELTDRMDDVERVAAAKAALAALRPAEREVFALCVWSGLDYATAAEALGVPVGTVRSRLSRARTKLRALAERALPPAPAPPAAPPGPAPPGARESAPPAAREPAPLPGQVQGGRATAARSNQEMNR